MDFSPNSSSRISIYLEHLGKPFSSVNSYFTSVVVTVTVINPANSEVVSSQVATGDSSYPGRWFYDLSADDVSSTGTYTAIWEGTAIDQDNGNNEVQIREENVFTVGFSPFTLTRFDLRKMMSTILGDWKEGKVTSSPSTNSFIDTRRIEYDNDIRGHNFYVFRGTNAGQHSRTVSSNTKESKLITIEPEYAGALSTSSEYELHKKFTVEEYNNAIDFAIYDVMQIALVRVEETSDVVTTSDSHYNLPKGWTHISSVQIEWIDNFWKDLAPVEWNILPATRKLVLTNNSSWGYSGRRIRLLGLAPPSKMIHDTSICEVFPTFVINKALSVLMSSRMGGNMTDSDDSRQRKIIFDGEAERARDSVIVNIPANTRRIR